MSFCYTPETGSYRHPMKLATGELRKEVFSGGFPGNVLRANTIIRSISNQATKSRAPVALCQVTTRWGRSKQGDGISMPPPGHNHPCAINTCECVYDQTPDVINAIILLLCGLTKALHAG